MIPYLFEKNYHGSGCMIGALPDWIDCAVTEERNGGFYLEGTLPVGALNVDHLAIDRIITASPSPGNLPQPFRIREISKEKDGDEIHVLAQHVSYQLTEYFVKASYTGRNKSAQWILDDALNRSGIDNNHVVPLISGSFVFSSDITAASPVDMTISEPISVRSFLGGNENSMISKFGGELFWDRWSVMLLKSRGTERDVEIAYARNMESLEYSVDANNLVTGYYGWWRDSNGMFLKEAVVYKPNADEFAYARIQPVDLSSELEPPEGQSTPTDAQMQEATQAYANARSSNELVTSITVTAIPDELQSVYLCDTVTVIHPGYQLKQKAKIVQTVFNPILERYTSLTIGTIKKSITDTILQVYARRVENELTNH